MQQLAARKKQNTRVIPVQQPDALSFVSEFTLTQALPQELKSTLPTVEEFENHLLICLQPNEQRFKVVLSLKDR